MATISDEIRAWCDEADVDGDACGALRVLADRIDREMVELPKDRDGAPIHIGDTVYLESGSKSDVKSIAFTKDENSVVFTVCGTGFIASPCNLSHERSDSLGRIAEDLKDWGETEQIAGCPDVYDGIAYFAERISKLAERED